MKELRRYCIYIIICLVAFFNIERLDFGQQNLINIQSEIYILGFAAVILTLLVPRIYRSSVSIILFFWTAVYLAFKVIPLGEHPLFGGSYSFLTITELVFILLLVYLSQHLARILSEYASATEILSLAGIDTSLPDIHGISDQIQSEINRSRRYSRPMSVVLIRADLNSTQLVLPSLLAEVQASFIQRYLNAKVAHIIKKEMRRMDILATDHKAEHLVVINPETNEQETAIFVKRMQAAVDHELGISISLSTASFPDQAYSFEDLLEIAEKDLKTTKLNAGSIPPYNRGERQAEK